MVGRAGGADWDGITEKSFSSPLFYLSEMLFAWCFLFLSLLSVWIATAENSRPETAAVIIKLEIICLSFGGFPIAVHLAFSL